jgi:hypothetical protein
MRFHTKILQTGKNTAGIEVPPEVVAALSASRKPAVKITLNGYTYRSTVAVMGGKFMVGLSAANRAASGVKGGDETDVDIELDTEERVLAIPDDFAAALNANPDAKTFFESLSYSNKSRHTLNIEGTKNPETRQRRIEKSIADLKAGKK